MKKLCLLAIPCMMIGSAWAGQKMSDLMHIPEAGQFLYQGELEKSSSEYTLKTLKVDGSTLTNTSSKYETDSMEFKNSFDYGLNNDFSLGLEINYTIKDETKNVSGITQGTVTDPSELSRPYDDKGLQDPAINARYRFLKNDLLMDAYGSFSPSVADAEHGNAYTEGTPTAYKAEDGNAFRGGHQLRAGVILGNKGSSAFQWLATAGLTHNMEQEAIEKKGDTNSASLKIDATSTTEASTDFNIGAQGQYELTRQFNLGLNLQYDMIGEVTKTTPLYYSTATVNRTKKEVSDSHGDITVGAFAKYEFTKDLLANFSVSYMKGGDLDYNVTNASATTGAAIADDCGSYQMIDRSALTFALGVDFQF